MAIQVRERPPTRLTVSVQTPAGPTYRWGADDQHTPQNVPDGLSFQTTMPGGFDSATLTLERDPRINWPDLQELSTVTIYGLGGAQVAYQGRIEEFPSQAGSDSNFSPTIAGWQNHLQDTNDASMIYLDSDLTAWTSPTAARQAALVAADYQLGSAQVGADPTSNPPVPALVQTITDSWSSPYKPAVETWYTAAPGCLIAKIYFSVALDAFMSADTNWSYQVNVASDSNATGYTGTGNRPSSPQLWTPPSQYGFALVSFQYPNTNAGAQGAQYDAYWDSLQVIGNHGLTLQGSGPYTILASDVIAHAVGAWAPALDFTTGSSGTIQPSSFGIPQLTFSAQTPLAIVQQASEYELLDYAVWEATAGTTGPTLYVNERGARGRQWVSRVGPAQLQNAGPQVARICNGVIVQFTAPDGTTQTVGPPGSNTTAQSSTLLDVDPTNPATVAGINKWYLLTMGSSTQAGAIQTGAFYLEEQLAANTSGQASLVGHVQDYGTGSWWPAWMVRAADTISFVDAADASFRRIVSTSYDDTSRTNTIQLDSPPDDMTALLDRLSAVLAPIGLS